MTDTLKPGRALDRLIAERLGWTEIEEKSLVHTFETSLQGVQPGERASATGYRPKHVIPRFSTEIAAALELVERMQNKGYRTEVVYGSQRDAYVTFVIGGVRFRADSSAIPHAIGLAFLKATEDKA